MVNLTLRLLYPRESEPVPTEQKNSLAPKTVWKYWGRGNLLPPAEFDLRNVQNVASRRSDHAIPASLVYDLHICRAVSGMWSYVENLKYVGKRFSGPIVCVCVCVCECDCVCEREREVSV